MAVATNLNFFTFTRSASVSYSGNAKCKQAVPHKRFGEDEGLPSKGDFPEAFRLI